MKLKSFKFIPGFVLMIVSFLYIRKMKGCECADQEIVKKITLL